MRVIIHLVNFTFRAMVAASILFSMIFAMFAVLVFGYLIAFA